MQDLGNPNFFKIFQGKVEVALHDGVTSANPGVMLSLTNELQFLGDYNVAADAIIGVLPEGYRPKSITYFTVSETLGETTNPSSAIIYPDGTLMVGRGGVTAHTTGIVVNLSGDWY